MFPFGSWARSVAGPVAVAFLAPFASVEIAQEPTRPTPSLGLAWRKDCSVDDAEPRTLPLLGTLLNAHSREVAVLSESEPTAERFSALLEDRVTGSRREMDPKLIGLLREVAGGRAPIRVEIVSGYRSWKLNEQLRKKGRRVASHSQHSLGEAIDFRVQGMTTAQLRKAIEDAHWQGGIGYYPKSSDRFVHADAGPKRKWIGK
jgi:uncharacterized protein YcbK (DUF882 family)